MFIKKISSIILTFGMFINNIGFLKNDLYQANAHPISATASENSRYKEMVKKLNITTCVDNMSDSEVTKYRDEQIRKFQKINNRIFEINPDFIDELPPKVSALIVKQINDIFAAYPYITNSFIDMKESNAQTFELGLMSGKEIISDLRALAYYSSYGAIVFDKSCFNDFERALIDAHSQILSGWSPYADNNKLIGFTAAHEMGHLIQDVIRNCSISYRFINIEHKYYSEEQKDYEAAGLMKQKIIKIAKEKFNYNGDGYISEYGKTNDCEWFAELCSHYFCSDKPNALGLALKVFLDQQEEYLSKECSCKLFGLLNAA